VRKRRKEGGKDRWIGEDWSGEEGNGANAEDNLEVFSKGGGEKEEGRTRRFM